MAVLLEAEPTQGVTDTGITDQGSFAILEKNPLLRVRKVMHAVRLGISEFSAISGLWRKWIVPDRALLS
jgi:hypothetical protein